MLQIPPAKTPPQFVRAPASPRKRRTNSMLNIIDAAICPLDTERDLLDKLCYLKDANDVSSTIALYDAYAASAKLFESFLNQPRAGDAAEYLEDESDRAWSKAYLIADFLKDMRPNRFNIEAYIQTLFNCSLQMGNNLADVVCLFNELAHKYSALVKGGR